jgi:hypothetical protein
MDRQSQKKAPNDPDLGFRWAIYALLAAAMAIRFGPAAMDLLP